MDSTDIFYELRKDFDNFWGTFQLGSRKNKKSPVKTEASSDTESDSSSDSGSDFGSDRDICEILVNFHASVINLKDWPVYKMQPVLDQLNSACEELQKYKISLGEEEMSVKVENILGLILHDMMHCKLIGQNINFKVKWYGHLLHNLKLLGIPHSDSYIQLLWTFDKYWDKLVKNSSIDDKRYLNKLMAFVSHLDGAKHAKSQQTEKEMENTDRAYLLYTKSTTWVNDGIKEYLEEQLDVIRREQERKAYKIGPDGGRLISNYCEIMIPKGALKDDKDMKLNVTAERTMLPIDVLPISPVMNFQPIVNFEEPADMRIPTWCSTDHPEVEAQVLSYENATSEWTEVYKAPLKDVKRDLSFKTKLANKIVVAIKKIFSQHTTYKLHSDIWFTPQGNFTGVFYVNDKVVKQAWQQELVIKGFKSSQLVTNPITVSGDDAIRMELSVLGSKVVKFDKFSSDVFKVRENIAKNEQRCYANFLLLTLPVGDERFNLSCVVTQEEEIVVKENWCEIWPAMTGQPIEKVFQDEIIPSFAEPHVWKKFVCASNGLCLTDREMNRLIALDRGKPTKEQRAQKMKILLLWLQNNRGAGKRGDNRQDNDLIGTIRELTIKFRENPSLI